MWTKHYNTKIYAKYDLPEKWTIYHTINKCFQRVLNDAEAGMKR